MQSGAKREEDSRATNRSPRSKSVEEAGRLATAWLPFVLVGVSHVQQYEKFLRHMSHLCSLQQGDNDSIVEPAHHPVTYPKKTVEPDPDALPRARRRNQSNPTLLM